MLCIGEGRKVSEDDSRLSFVWKPVETRRVSLELCNEYNLFLNLSVLFMSFLWPDAHWTPQAFFF